MATDITTTVAERTVMVPRWVIQDQIDHMKSEIASGERWWDDLPAGEKADLTGFKQDISRFEEMLRLNQDEHLQCTLAEAEHNGWNMYS